jgi:hypothetical protein
MTGPVFAPKISPVQRGRELGINPLALLPGSKPTITPELTPNNDDPITTKKQVLPEVKQIKDSADTPTDNESIISTPSEEATSFDNPISASTLHCPGKASYFDFYYYA